MPFSNETVTSRPAAPRTVVVIPGLSMDQELLSRIEKHVDEHMAAKVGQWGPDVMRYVEKTILLQTLDHLWREHLVMLDHLR